MRSMMVRLCREYVNIAHGQRGEVMARKVTEIEINSETSQEELELCTAAAGRTIDTNMQRIAAR